MESFLNPIDDQLEPKTVPSNSDNDDELLAWRDVHTTLLMAVQKAQEAIVIQKAQRRYWLEEIVYNIDDTGRLSNRSVWHRPVRARTTDTKETTKQKKKKSTKDGTTKLPVTTALSTVATGATNVKKKKVSKGGESGLKVKLNSDPEISAPVVKKRRRKKNDPDEAATAIKPKRAKIMIQRTGSSNIKAKSKISTTTTSVLSTERYHHEGYFEESNDGDEHYGDHDFSDRNDYSTTSPQHQPALSPGYKNPNMNNNDSFNDNQICHDDDDDNLEDQDGSLSISPSSLLLVSRSPIHSTATPTTMIRNYTSLQDIAINEDDSDEDRF